MSCGAVESTFTAAKAIYRIGDGRQKQPFRIGRGKSAVGSPQPLHGGAHTVAVAQQKVVAHADLVSIIENGRARHGHQQQIHQFNPVPVVLQQWGEPAANAQMEARLRVDRIRLMEIVPLAVGDHLQGQFVVVAQKYRPLAAVRNVRVSAP